MSSTNMNGLTIHVAFWADMTGDLVRFHPVIGAVHDSDTFKLPSHY